MVWPQVCKMLRQAVISLSKLLILSSCMFIALASLGCAGSKKARQIEMAAVNRIISSGNIGKCSSEGIELENGFWAGKVQPWVGQTNPLETKRLLGEKHQHDISDKHECSVLFQDSLQWKKTALTCLCGIHTTETKQVCNKPGI